MFIFIKYAKTTLDYFHDGIKTTNYHMIISISSNLHKIHQRPEKWINEFPSWNFIVALMIGWTADCLKVLKSSAGGEKMKKVDKLKKKYVILSLIYIIMPDSLKSQLIQTILQSSKKIKNHQKFKNIFCFAIILRQFIENIFTSSKDVNENNFEWINKPRFTIDREKSIIFFHHGLSKMKYENEFIENWDIPIYTPVVQKY